jgi:tetratricopeptide (TPR) repeat protein
MSVADDIAQWQAEASRRFDAGEPAAAGELFRRILACEPDSIPALHGLAAVELVLGQFAAAEGLARTLTAIASDWPHGFLLLGHAHLHQDHWSDAADAYGRAVQLAPTLPDARFGYGLALLKMGRVAECEPQFRHVVEVNPAAGEAWLHLASSLRYLSRLPEALAAYQRGLALIGDDAPLSVVAHCEMAITALALGDYAVGFREYEWRLKGALRHKLEATRPFGPHWDGRVRPGQAIILWHEQGLGDTLHFARYARQLGEWGMRVFLWVPIALKRMLAGLPGVEAVLADGDDVPMVDVQAPLLSVPHLLYRGGRGVVVPRLVPYVDVPPADAERWRAELAAFAGGRRRIGVVWAGNAAYSQDGRRSLCLDDLAPLLEVEDCAFFSLQMGERRLPPQGHPRLIDLAERIGDFADTAAIMSALDLVISADTSTIHCAGAVGRPGWVLLPTRPDWRWGTAGTATVWYPTVRIFRQQRDGDWGSVVSRMAGELRLLRGKVL